MSHHVAVIGAGPGGYAAAFYAADLGMKVTLIDNEKNPGGVCLYRGCIPSKALLHVAKVLDESKHAANWGIEFGEAKVDINKLRDYKNRVVEKLTSGTGQVSKLRKINYIQGWASIVDPKTITVKKADGGDETVAVDYMILALGSLPTKIPSLSIDSPRVLDSTGALDLPEIPKTMLVIGGGYIGLELGSVYAALGTKVSVVEMTPGLLPGADRDLVKFLAQRVEKTFDKVMVSTKVTSMKASAKSVTVNFEGEGAPKEATYDYVLISIGRRPNAKIDGPRQDQGQGRRQGLHRNRRPAPHRRADDLRDRRRGGRADARAQGVARSARRGGSDRRARRRCSNRPRFPRWCSPIPEIAWAGITEAEAEKQGLKVEVAKFPWPASGRAIAIDRIDGMTKLIIEPETERILGVGIAGAGAGELIAEGVLAIEMGATASDLKLSIHPHPTLTETLMESAEVFFGQATHVFKPRRK